MPVAEFPPPMLADEHGIVAVGGDLHPISLLAAYRQGIFPWPIEGLGLAWFSPDPRTILAFDDLHLSHSFKKFLKRQNFTVTFDQAFGRVIAECAGQVRPGQKGTWITPALKRAYELFHREGYAHSVEVWEGKNLIGGLYGVAIDGVFSAESMFYKKPNASKLAVVRLVEYLRTKGVGWIDIQVMTPHMQKLGAREISRREFLKKLTKSQNSRLRLFDSHMLSGSKT